MAEKKTTTTKKAATKKPVVKVEFNELIHCRECGKCRDNVLYGSLFCTGWNRALKDDKGFCHLAEPKA